MAIHKVRSFSYQFLNFYYPQLSKRRNAADNTCTPLIMYLIFQTLFVIYPYFEIFKYSVVYFVYKTCTTFLKTVNSSSKDANWQFNWNLQVGYILRLLTATVIGHWSYSKYLIFIGNNFTWTVRLWWLYRYSYLKLLKLFGLV